MKEKETKIKKVTVSSYDKDSIDNDLIQVESDLPTIIPHVDRVADFLLFAQWFATPKVLREQKTQKDFASTIRIDEDTLTNWKHNKYFWPIAQQFINKWIKERIPDVINSLYLTACEEGKAQEVKAFLELGGMINDSKK